MSDYAEFDRRLSRYFEASVSAEELAELEAKLLADSNFADHVARWCVMHRQITELRTEHALHELMDQFVQGTPALPKAILSQLEHSSERMPSETRGGIAPARGQDDGQRGHPRWWMLPSLAVALFAVVGLGAAMWQLGHRAARQDAAATAQNANTPAVVLFRPEPASGMAATLTQLTDAVWESSAAALEYGQQLDSGSRVALRSGMAKVTFECGAEVVLQGPCDFTVESKMVGFLRSGRMTANVPRRAFSFSIFSPEVDFVDMGTAFGVNVGGDGQTELHVFEGEVMCGPSKDDLLERKGIIHVAANKALEFKSQQRDPKDIVMDKQPFSHLIASRHATESPSTRVIPDRLALWLSADTSVKTDSSERVIAWQDIVYGDNVSAEDAVQTDTMARPALIKDGIGGQPAVRFDGDSDFLLTTPLETTNDQTVLFVCQYSPSAFDKGRVWGGQILNYDGPPSRYLSDTMEPGVLQIGEPLLKEDFKPTLLTGQVFAGFIGAATVEAGRVDAVQVGANVPVVVSYLYDYSHGRAVLSINGHSYGEARAFAPQGITSRKIIGRHAWMHNFFHGDLAELLIYNGALSPQQLAESTAYLAEKYSISLDAQIVAQSEVGK